MSCILNLSSTLVFTQSLSNIEKYSFLRLYFFFPEHLASLFPYPEIKDCNWLLIRVKCTGNIVLQIGLYVKLSITKNFKVEKDLIETKLCVHNTFWRVCWFKKCKYRKCLEIRSWNDASQVFVPAVNLS
jgi:hypothetical protein